MTTKAGAGVHWKDFIMANTDVFIYQIIEKSLLLRTSTADSSAKTEQTTATNERKIENGRFEYFLHGWTRHESLVRRAN